MLALHGFPHLLLGVSAVWPLIAIAISVSPLLSTVPMVHWVCLDLAVHHGVGCCQHVPRAGLQTHLASWQDTRVTFVKESLQNMHRSDGFFSAGTRVLVAVGGANYAKWCEATANSLSLSAPMR